MLNISESGDRITFMPMKKYSLVLLSFMLLLSLKGLAQDSTVVPVYKRFPTVPVFRILSAPDSTVFTRDNLSEKKPVMFMMFSPDCDHCQHATEDLKRNMDAFKKVQIVMVSSLDYDHILAFYHTYGLDAYPNITVGRDPAYMLGTFFSVHNFPSIYLYDKKGKLKANFEGSVPFKKIAESL